MKRYMHVRNAELLPKLVKLGLTRQESELYLAILDEGSASAKSLAEKTNISVNGVYRTIRSLKLKGFTVFLDTFPKRFQAIPPVVAITSFVQHKEQSLEGLKNQITHSLLETKPAEVATKIDVVVGRTETYNTFIKLATTAKKEILVISIGEQVPDEIKLAHRDAKDRGVAQKLLFHKYDKENKEILRSWVRMGIKVRHYPDWGFHLMVFDGKRSILVANNPKETEERTGMVIHSEALSRALRDYFHSVWEKATPIKL